MIGRFALSRRTAIVGAFLGLATARSLRAQATPISTPLRALLGIAVGQPVERRRALALDAVARAEATLTARPEDAASRLLLIGGLGLLGRVSSRIDSVRKGYARRARVELRTLLAAAPQEPWTHALDGAWHFEVLRRGGGIGASMLGASRAAGDAAFRRALALAPADPVIRFAYAVALVSLDARATAEATRLLTPAASAAGGDAAQVAAAREARTLLALLGGEDSSAARQRALDIM